MSIRLRSISERFDQSIDQTRELRAEDMHPKAQRFRLSIWIHGP
jgi:hypothetical protein